MWGGREAPGMHPGSAVVIEGGIEEHEEGLAILLLAQGLEQVGEGEWAESVRGKLGRQAGAVDARVVVEDGDEPADHVFEPLGFELLAGGPHIGRE